MSDADMAKALAELRGMQQVKGGTHEPIKPDGAPHPTQSTPQTTATPEQKGAARVETAHSIGQAPYAIREQVTPAQAVQPPNADMAKALAELRQPAPGAAPARPTDATLKSALADIKPLQSDPAKPKPQEQENRPEQPKPSR